MAHFLVAMAGGWIIPRQVLPAGFRQMRAFLVLTCCCISAGSFSSESAWPLRNDSETVEEYARRAGLRVRETVDVGEGVIIELVHSPRLAKDTPGT